MNKRILARLDVKNSKLIKSIRYEGLRVIGEINDYALSYYNKGIHEIIYIDTVASLYGRNCLTEAIEFASKNIFVPITVGGGIRNVNDIRNILLNGGDKVAINSQAIKNPNFITEAAQLFGSQCIVISIQAKKRTKGWEAFYLNGRESSGIDVIDWAQRVESLGAGEILLTSIDKDGTESGLDSELIEQVSKKVNIPVIGSGGLKNLDDLCNIFMNTEVSGIAVGSILHHNKMDLIEAVNKLNKKL